MTRFDEGERTLFFAMSLLLFLSSCKEKNHILLGIDMACHSEYSRQKNPNVFLKIHEKVLAYTKQTSNSKVEILWRQERLPNLPYLHQFQIIKSNPNLRATSEFE